MKNTKASPKPEQKVGREPTEEIAWGKRLIENEVIE